jgi:hypothetical protein
MSFLSGVQLLAMGILGEYLGRLFEEVKGRPPFIVRAKLNFHHDTTDRPVFDPRRPD